MKTPVSESDLGNTVGKMELPHLAGNLTDDAHTAILLREHRIRRVCTRDKDIHLFPEVLDPVPS